MYILYNIEFSNRHINKTSFEDLIKMYYCFDCIVLQLERLFPVTMASCKKAGDSFCNTYKFATKKKQIIMFY